MKCNNCDSELEGIKYSISIEEVLMCDDNKTTKIDSILCQSCMVDLVEHFHEGWYLIDYDCK